MSGSSDLKYTFNETKKWAQAESEPNSSGTTFLYVFGAIAFLFIFAAFLLIFASPSQPSPPSSVRIEDIGSETDSASTEVHSEYDLIEDIKKPQNSVKEAK